MNCQFNVIPGLAAATRPADALRTRPGMRVVRTVLVTGFGPFPGVRSNPTEQLVRALGRSRAPPASRRIIHVFQTSYAAVDRELPALIRQHNPSVVLMFGVATG